VAIFPQGGDFKAQLDPPYRERPIENVRRTSSEDGTTLLRDLWGRDKYAAEFAMELSPEDSATLIAFRDANRESTFTFFSYDPTIKFVAEQIGTASGLPQSILIPAKETANHLVYADAVLIAGPYNMGYGLGPLGQDWVTINQTAGKIITITYTGRHLYTVDMVSYDFEVINTLGRKRFNIRVEEAF
jgi:hypothetical protein